MHAIVVQTLSREFHGRTVVQNLSFSVARGEIFGLLGPNGAGKTTTIRMLTGQLRPTSGQARVMEYDIVEERSKIKPIIGVVFEKQNLYSRLSAVDNLNFAAKLYGVRQKRVQEMLGLVGLAGRGKERVSQYSNGMKQRLMIARALLHEPEVIFLDEPTKGLDPRVGRDIRLLVADLSNGGMTVFLTTHYMEEADKLCDRIGILNAGELVDLDTPSALKEKSGLNEPTLEDVFLLSTGRELH